MLGITMSRADWIGIAVITCLIALAVWFVLLDWRAMERRPDLYGPGGRFGRRSSSVWFLLALIAGAAAYGLIRLMSSGR